MQLSQFSVTGNVLALEVRTETRPARFKAICRDMDQAVAALGRVRLVLVMRHYPSLNSTEDFYDDLRFLRLYDQAIERVAVVCDRSWKETWVGVFSLFSGIQMAFFDLSRADAAARWVAEA